MLSAAGMRSAFGPSLATATLLLTIAACGAQGGPVRAYTTPALRQGAAHVVTVDVLPLDVRVGAKSGLKESEAELTHRFVTSAQGTLAGGLLRRGLRVVSEIGWDGRYLGPDGQVAPAFTQEELYAVLDAFAHFSAAQAAQSTLLPYPYLPVKLGTTTGADATLYVGGYAFAGDQGSRAGKVAKYVLIGAVIVVAVVVVAILAGKGGGSVGRAAGGMAEAAAKTVAPVLRTTGRAAGLAGRAALAGARTAGRMTLNVLEATARLPVDIYVHSHPGPAYVQARPAEPPKKGRSKIMIEMTLVDNRTGLTLWHAQKLFRADPRNHGQVSRAVAKLLETLPRQW